MAETARALSADPALLDQRIFLRGVTWDDYERLLVLRGDDPGLRMTCLEGELELMSPSKHHQRLKKRWARLLEAWSEEVGIDLEGIGSWTIRNQLQERGLEPDECYFVGGHKPAAATPDVALEVLWTSGGLDKLAVYAGLGVREVWFWKDGRISFHALRDGAYKEIARSELLSEFDPGLVGPLVNAASSQAEAVRALRAALRSSKS